MSNTKKCPFCAEEININATKCPKCQKDLRNWFARHIVLSIVLVFILLGVYGNTIEDEQENNSIGEQVNSKTVEKIIITAETLAKEYEENEVRADKKYKGKVAEISGSIQDIGVIFGTTYVTLKSWKEFSFVSVQCSFNKKEEIEKVGELNKGDYIKIVGIIEGKGMNVEVKKCIIK